MVELIPKTVVPLDIVERDSCQFVGGMSVQQVEQRRKGFAGSLELLPCWTATPARTLGKAQIGLDCQFNGVVDTDHCDSAV
jgi:hypothetical protein